MLTLLLGGLKPHQHFHRLPFYSSAEQKKKLMALGLSYESNRHD